VISHTRTQLGAMRESFALLWSALDKVALRQFGFALEMVLAGSLGSSAAPLAFKWLIDSQLPHSSTFLAWSPLLLLGAYVAGQFLFKACAALRQYASAVGTQRLNRNISRQIAEHLFSLPMSFHTERKTGALGETLTQGIRGYETIVEHSLYTFLPVAIEFLVTVLVLAQLHRAIYLLILLVTAFAYTIAFSRGAANVTAPASEIADSHIEAQATLTDSLLNYETIKYFGAERAIVCHYDEKLLGIERAWRFYSKRVVTNGLFLSTIFIASLAISLWLATKEVIAGTMTVGDLVLINSYVLRMVQPLESIGYAVRDTAQALSFLGQLLSLKRQASENDSGGGRQLNDVRGLIEFRNVHFSYGGNSHILKDVSFRVPAGRTLAIVGGSGAGKSSIVKLLFRLYPVDSGSILLDGINLCELSLSDLRGRVAIVPQDSALFNDTIGYNIAFGKSGANQQEIENAARVAHIHQWIMTLPKKYETPVGERGVKMSGGQRQRVAIARAIIRRPRILVFDEATSSLDTRTEQDIQRNLMEISRDCTTLLIAHRLSTVAHADEIIVIDNGCIVETGTHSELLMAGGAYSRLWQAQQMDVRGSDAVIA
jgi:ABC-type transport system involved in Fe-S cluster assembly fused permease/ATPase subunit